VESIPAVHESERDLSPEQLLQIERLSNERRRIKDEEIFVEDSPLFDQRGKPTPIPEREGPGWCGKANCPYMHGLLEPHETPAARDEASARHRDEAGVSRRYHVDIQINDSWMIDARQIRSFLSVAALEAQEPAALAALRMLRDAHVGLLYVAESANGTHPKLLIFSEDFGFGIQIVATWVVAHSPGTGGGSTRRSYTGARATATLRRLRQVSMRAKVGAVLSEALLVYACGELAALLLGDGDHLLSDRVTLPVWLLATPLIVLGTAVKWLVWRQWRPALHLAIRRLATLYAREANRAAGWVANLDAEGMGKRYDEPRRPAMPWHQSPQTSQPPELQSLP
jgi:hypothetical protein